LGDNRETFLFGALGEFEEGVGFSGKHRPRENPMDLSVYVLVVDAFRVPAPGGIYDIGTCFGSGSRIFF
jgi:hypothetical protein